MITESELNDLYQELSEPKSWHWIINKKTGLFKKEQRFAEEKHITDILSELDKENPKNAERLRVYLKSLRTEFSVKRQLLSLPTIKINNKYETPIDAIDKILNEKKDSTEEHKLSKKQKIIRLGIAATIVAGTSRVPAINHYLETKQLPNAAYQEGPIQINQCAAFVIDAASSIYNLDKHILTNVYGISGNAWTMLNNVTKIGTPIYNEFEEIYSQHNSELEELHKEIKNKYDVLYQAAIKNGKNNAKAKVIAYDELIEYSPRIKQYLENKPAASINISQLRVGDIIGMYYADTTHIAESFIAGTGKNGWRSFNTHVGIVTEIRPDGTIIISHQMAHENTGNLVQNTAQELLTTNNDVHCRIVWAARPNIWSKITA